jgi:pimeloyl-ACP methyl ester carboxylesterase
MLLAATYPERVERLMLLDALGPLVNAEEESPKQLRDGIDRFLQGSTPPLIYERLERMIKARQQGIGKLSETSAALMTRRNVKAVDGGYSWRTDSRLRWPSLQRMSECQVYGFLDAISCPTLLIAGLQGFVKADNPMVADRLQRIRNLRFEHEEGGHHLHMEPNPQAVANRLADFLADWT